MAEIPASHSFIKEEFALYTGPTNSRFAPLLAGITFPNPSYEIRRSKSECYVFEYVLDGRGYVMQRDVLLTMKKGDAYILHRGESHHYYSDKKDPWKKIWFNVNGSLVRHLLSDYGLDTVVKIPSFGEAKYLSAIFELMKDLQNQTPPRFASQLIDPKEPAHCAEELALLLHQYVQKLSVFVGEQTQSPSQAQDLKNYIEQNLMLPLSIENMAEHVHLSRSRAIHLFKEAYGITPYHYYLSQKGELACTLLKCTSLSIQEISDRLGFSDYHHFSGFFRKWYGVSPSGFR